jgi:superkiller protein 3
MKHCTLLLVLILPIFLFSCSGDAAHKSFADADFELRNGNIAQARTLLEKATQEDQNFAQAFHALGTVYYTQGEFEKAIEMLRKSVELRNDNPNALTMLGNAYGKTGKFADAKEAYSKAISMHPQDAALTANLASTQVNLGAFPQAVELYRKAIELNPTDPEPYYNLGNTLGRNKQFEDALKAYRGATQLNPRYAEAWLYMGITYAKMGQDDMARFALQRAATINPEMPVGYKYLSEICRRKGENAQADNYQGLMLAQTGKIEQSLELFLQAQKGNPAFAEAWYNAGIAYATLNDKAKAQAQFEKTIALQPDFVGAYRQLSVLYAQNGLLEKAGEADKKAVELENKLQFSQKLK